MPKITNQKQFQEHPKPHFCYLCGKTFEAGDTLNKDHCPPSGMFAAEDKIDYPIKLSVHGACNHKWHVEDEKMAIFYDILHGNVKASNPQLVKKLSFRKIENDQGVYQGIINFPIRPLTKRIIRCIHAVLYGEYLPRETPHHIHYPIPEVDVQNNNKPIPHEIQTYDFSNELCIAQKTNTFDTITAYNNAFKYVCTWTRLDNGTPICIFSFDIYRLSAFAVRIEGFPKAVIGFYAVNTIPLNSTRCSDQSFENTDEEILYPILDVNL